MLIVNGYLYSDALDKKKWNCPAWVHTDQQIANLTRSSKLKEHNHSEDLFEIKKYSFNNEVKRLSLGKDGPDQIPVKAALDNEIDSSDFDKLTNFPNIKKRIHFYRLMYGIWKRISNRKDITFIEEETKTLNGKKFLFYDSRWDDADCKVVILIWTEENIEILRESLHWGADGTFDKCPKIYGQFYTIHCNKYPALPMIFAVLPNAKQATYDKFASKVLEIVEICPLSFIIDYERAARNAFSKVFTLALISGCNFHFKQAIMSAKYVFQIYFILK